MDMGIKEARLKILEVEGHGDTAIEVSTFTLQVAGRCLPLSSLWPWPTASTSPTTIASSIELAGRPGSAARYCRV
jgi:hypothetical protein